MAQSAGDKALKKLHDSIDAAQAAVKDLRSEMSRGSRGLLKDVDSTLRDARKNLRSVTRHVSKDLDEAKQAATDKRKPAQRRTRSATRSSSRRRTAAKK